jgi:hypothetical protein
MTSNNYLPSWAVVDISAGTQYPDSVRFWTNRIRRSEYASEISIDVARRLDYDKEEYFRIQIETGGCCVCAEMTPEQMQQVFVLFTRAMHTPFTPKDDD